MHTHVITTLARMLTIRMRYADRLSMRDDYPQSGAACDHMTLGRQSTCIARHRSYIELKFIAKHSQSKVPLYQLSEVVIATVIVPFVHSFL
jgi:hypothetical protein